MDDIDQRRRIEAALKAAFDGVLAELACDTGADRRRAAEIAIDTVLDYAPLPWGVPRGLLKPALIATLLQLLEARAADN
jgi:hypothetical protein